MLGLLASLLVAAVVSVPCFDGDYIDFGVATARTGGKAKKGGECLDGFYYAIQKINEDGGVKCGTDGQGNDKFYQLRLDSSNIIDDLSSTSGTRDGVTQLVQKPEIDFILGPYSSSCTAEANKVTNANNRVLIYAAASADEFFTKPADDSQAYDPQSNDFYGTYNFGFSTPASQYQEAAIQGLIAKGVKKACILARQSTFPGYVADASWESLTRLGIGIPHATKEDVFYHETGDTDAADILVREHLNNCRNFGAEAILACTNDFIDAERYVRQLDEMDWYPKALSVTVYVNSDFVHDLGDKTMHTLGPVQWSQDLATTADSLANTPGKTTIFGTAREMADDWMARGYGKGGGTPAAVNEPMPNIPPSYQAAASALSVLMYKTAIEKAGVANPDLAITQMMVRDQLYTMDEHTFYGRVRFMPSGLMMGHSSTSPKPMYTTQVQLNPAGEIPVVLPAEDASYRSDEGRFEFQYPSLLSKAYQLGLAGSTEVAQCQADLSKARADADSDCSEKTTMWVFIVVAVLLLIIMGIIVYKEISGDACFSPGNRVSPAIM